MGYGLEYKITNQRMHDYLAPTYLILRSSHPELRFPEFIGEVVKVRDEERKKQGLVSGSNSDCNKHGVLACLDAVSGEGQWT